jgi:DNA-directed RNA polymerase subunit RPC12/RpoP
MTVPATIDCVECGGIAHLLGVEPELGWAEGDLLVYRCADCRERFDLLVEPADLEPAGRDDHTT